MNLTVNVATTSLTLPTGLSVAGIRVTITDAQGAAVTDTNGSAIAPVVLTSPPAGMPYLASFGSVPAGSFVAVAAAVDTSGAVIGSPISQPFSVPAQPAGLTYDAPATLTVTLQS